MQMTTKSLGITLGAGALTAIVGAIGLGVLFGGHYFTHLTHLTGNRLCSSMLAGAAGTALVFGMALTLLAGFKKPSNKTGWKTIEGQT